MVSITFSSSTELSAQDERERRKGEQLQTQLAQQLAFVETHK